MGSFGIARNGGLCAIVTGGSASSGADCSRFYYGVPIREVAWDNSQIGLIACKSGIGNRWVLRHFCFWGVSEDVYAQISGYLTGVAIGNGGTFSFNGSTYLNSNNASNPLENGDAWTSSLSSGVGGSVLFHNYDSSHSYLISSDKYTDVSPNHLGGEACEYIANPDTHYRVKRWLMNGTQVFGSIKKATITLPSSSASIHVEFEQYEYSATVKASGGGEVAGAFSGYKEVGSSFGKLTAYTNDAENYRFAGWYVGYGDNLDASACTTLVTTDETFSPVMGESDVTYVAKFVSRKTKLSVSSTDGGVFDLFVNGGTVARDASSYVNEDARDGWVARLVAKAAARYYFSHWLAPLGETTTQSLYNADTSIALVAREENAFIANFSEKTVVSIGVSIEGIGRVSFSGDLSAGGSFTDGFTTSDTYIETDYLFKAEESNRLWGFVRWEYLVGSDWVSVGDGSGIGWISQVDGERLVVNVRAAQASGTHQLRAVFAKKATYTISAPEVIGENPITGALASGADSGCSVSDLPAPDEVVDGQPRWLEGTSVSLTASAGAKWVAEWIDVTLDEAETKRFEGGSASFVLTGNVLSIQVVFSAKRYRVQVGADKASALVGEGTFSYVNEKNEEVVGATDAEVYVDTRITLSAEAKAAYSSDRVAFCDWWLNGSRTELGASDSVVVAYGCVFEARFKSRHVFAIDGSRVENDARVWFGRVALSYEESGLATTGALPFVDGSGVEQHELGAWLICGSTYSLEAIALKVGQVQGYFTGWFEVNESGVSTRVEGWGAKVDGVVADVPKRLRAVFDDQEVWPILRLRNPSDGLFCSFSVSGVRPERTQTIKGEDGSDIVRTLVNANDYFCDAFSVIQVRLELFDTMARFKRWKRLSFGSVSAPGSVVEDEAYSETKDLSVFMSGDTHLVPVFWTGAPMVARAFLGDGVEATAGDVSIDGEALSEKSETEKSFAEGDEATFVASPRNGYRFDGWYHEAGCVTLLSLDARYVVTMDVSRTVYAKFVQDRDAIWTFGSGETTKTLHWRSRRVSVAQPVSWTCAQVDVEGSYDGVELVLGYGSSPELPLREDRYRVVDGNSRRLMVSGRPEKFLEVEVVSSEPVNFVAVSTSVSGLLGGGSE